MILERIVYDRTYFRGAEPDQPAHAQVIRHWRMDKWLQFDAESRAAFEVG